MFIRYSCCWNYTYSNHDRPKHWDLQRHFVHCCCFHIYVRNYGTLDPLVFLWNVTQVCHTFFVFLSFHRFSPAINSFPSPAFPLTHLLTCSLELINPSGVYKTIPTALQTCEINFVAGHLTDTLICLEMLQFSHWNPVLMVQY